MYKLCFFVPETYLDEVKDALFEAGAGRIGLYDCCCWQVKGVGQFRALEGSSPFLGDINRLKKVEEYKVEMVCEDQLISEVITALKLAHPYEEPAYDVWKLDNSLCAY